MKKSSIQGKSQDGHQSLKIEEGIQAGGPGMNYQSLSEIRKSPCTAAAWHRMPEMKQSEDSVPMEG